MFGSCAAGIGALELLGDWSFGSAWYCLASCLCSADGSVSIDADCVTCADQLTLAMLLECLDELNVVKKNI